MAQVSGTVVSIAQPAWPNWPYRQSRIEPARQDEPGGSGLADQPSGIRTSAAGLFTDDASCQATDESTANNRAGLEVGSTAASNLVACVSSGSRPDQYTPLKQLLPPLPVFGMCHLAVHGVELRA